MLTFWLLFFYVKKMNKFALPSPQNNPIYFTNRIMNITNPVLFTNLVILAFLSFTLGIFLFLKKSTQNKANIYLGIQMICFFLYFFQGFLYYGGLLEQFPYLIRTGLMFNLAIGPSIYFFIKASTQKNFKLRPKLYWHWIPVVLHILWHVPFLLQPNTAKIAWLERYIQEGVMHTSNLGLVAINLYLLSYYFVSLRLVLKYQQFQNKNASFIDIAYFRWLLYFCIVLLVPLATDLSMSMFGISAIGMPLLLASYTLFIFGIYAAIILKPAIFHALPNQIEETEEDVEKEKYKHSNLQEEQKEQYLQQLQSYMKHEKPYQKPDLTLPELAYSMNIPNNYLSQVINEKLDVNFIDFINQYRVECAKELLNSEKYEHYTIIAIGLEAGFNSKSAFYATFKRFTNTTPGKFRKSLFVS